MLSASETAYPRFKINPSAKERNELYTDSNTSWLSPENEPANPCSGPACCCY
jgi:hypothetical protein